jgi:hypothetical protein
MTSMIPWVATPSKEPVVALVQNQRKVGFGLLYCPGFGHCSFFAIHHGDVVGLGDIHEYARSGGFKAERLGMAGQLDLG